MADEDKLAALPAIRESLNILRVEYGGRLKGIEEHLEDLNGWVKESEADMRLRDTRLSILETKQLRLLNDYEDVSRRAQRLERAVYLMALVTPLASVLGGAIVKVLQIAGVI